MEETNQNKINITEDSGIFYKYALTLVDIPGLGTKTFSYLIPEDLKKDIKIGIPVLVPFGAKGLINAFVVGFSNYLDESIKAKSIAEILDKKEIFNLEYLKLLEWISNYYCCDINSVLQAAIPMKFLKQSKRIIKRTAKEIETSLSNLELKILEILDENKEYTVPYVQKKSKLSYSQFRKAIANLQKQDLVEIENILDENSQKTQFEKLIKFKTKLNANKRQLAILEELEKVSEANLIEFEKQVKTTRTTIKKLEQAGFLEIIEEEKYRNPLNILKISKQDSFPNLSEEQENAYKIIEQKINAKQTEPILIHGITASGKTEVYFKAIQKVLNEGKNVLFLAPEIALASQLTKRLAKRFGTEDVAIWHSSISEGERYDVWQRLRNNEIKILAGARSAVFAPLSNIGLIIIDEEHESTYKQSTPSPRYNAKTIAEKLSKMYNASLILGSATPDIPTYYRAVNSNNLIELKNRYNNVPLARVSIVDMREEFFKDNKSIFSRSLIREIEENLKNKKQTMLLMNRRGFSTQSQCNQCGEVIKCPHCAIPMVWHSSDNELKCHWCNYQIPMPKTCNMCGFDGIKSFGIGTQRIEAITKKLFPSAKIARMDSDILTSKTAHLDVLEAFSNGEIDILIGTQMIAKGLDNENVTLVGVINADSSFNLPDYRGAERGFQLLTQVAGRAGRGKENGKVYFQTANPDFYAIENAREQNYSKFYEEEILAREMFDYPPFSQVIKIIISSNNNFRAEKSAQEIALRLNSIIEKNSISERLILKGPSPCILEKINNDYRFQILIKNKMDKKGHFFISSFLQKITMPEDIKLTIDIDPLDIL